MRSSRATIYSTRSFTAQPSALIVVTHYPIESRPWWRWLPLPPACYQRYFQCHTWLHSGIVDYFWLMILLHSSSSVWRSCCCNYLSKASYNSQGCKNQTLFHFMHCSIGLCYDSFHFSPFAHETTMTVRLHCCYLHIKFSSIILWVTVTISLL